jgi:hypothetical protein
MLSKKQTEFLKLVKQALVLQLHPCFEVSTSDTELEIYILDLNYSAIQKMNLDKFYREYSGERNRDKREKLLENFAALTTKPYVVPGTYQDAKRYLVPQIISRWDWERINLLIQKDEEGLPIEEQTDLWLPCMKFGPRSLVAVIALRTPAFKTLLTQDIFDGWGVSLEEVFAASTELLIKSGGVDVIKLPEYEATYCARCGDNNILARILNNDLFANLPVKGKPTLFDADKNRLFITGSDDELGIKSGLQIFDETDGRFRKIPPIPIVFDNGELREFALPENHPSYWEAKSLYVGYLGHLYTNQSWIIKKNSSQQLRYIAKYAEISDAQHRTFSATTLPENADGALVPEADFIRFVRQRAEQEWEIVAMGKWDDVMKIVGHLFQDTDIYPPRYCLVNFPSDAELKAIGMNEMNDIASSSMAFREIWL